MSQPIVEYSAASELEKEKFFHNAPDCEFWYTWKSFAFFMTSVEIPFN